MPLIREDLDGQDQSVAVRDVRKLALDQPVRLQDVLARVSASRPGEGIVELEHTARNQRDEVVAVAIRSTLVRLRPESA